MKNPTLFLAMLLTVAALDAAAQERHTDVWINAGLISYHFDRNKHYREFNYGFGGEAIFSRDHGAMAGVVKNSESETTRYLGYQYRPLHWQPGGVNVHAGVAIAVLDGYPSMNNKGWFISPLPMVAVEGRRIGANFILIPNVKHGGAVAMQLKLKVW